MFVTAGAENAINSSFALGANAQSVPRRSLLYKYFRLRIIGAGNRIHSSTSIQLARKREKRYGRNVGRNARAGAVVSPKLGNCRCVT